MSKCNVQQLATDAGCFFCLSPGERQAAKLVLLCRIARSLNSSVSCNLNSLMANASGFVTLDAGMLDAVKAQLLCEISKGSGGAGLSVTLPTDVDAANFVCGWLNICSLNTGACTSTNNCPPGTSIPIGATCASFCGINQKLVNAISDLTTSLKSAGLWDLMDVIYPFVGGNAGACSLNMKDTTKFAITWHGGVTFNAAGATGDGATGYGDTGYNPLVNGVNYTLNSGSMGVYLSSIGSIAGPIFGASDGSVLSNNASLQTASTGALTFGLNASQERSAVFAETPGNFDATVTGAAQRDIYTPGGNATDSNAPLSTGVPNSNFFVMHTVGAATANLFNNSTCSFAFVGPGFSGAQIATLSGIINTFVAAK